MPACAPMPAVDVFQFQTGSIRSRDAVDNDRLKHYMFQFQTGSIRSQILYQVEDGEHAFQFQTGSIRSPFA